MLPANFFLVIVLKLPVLCCLIKRACTTNLAQFSFLSHTDFLRQTKPEKFLSAITMPIRHRPSSTSVKHTKKSSTSNRVSEGTSDGSSTVMKGFKKHKGSPNVGAQGHYSKGLKKGLATQKNDKQSSLSSLGTRSKKPTDSSKIENNKKSITKRPLSTKTRLPIRDQSPKLIRSELQDNVDKPDILGNSDSEESDEEMENDCMEFIGANVDEMEDQLSNNSDLRESEDEETVTYRSLEKKSAVLAKQTQNDLSNDLSIHVESGLPANADYDGEEELPFTGDLSVVKQRISEHATLLAHWATMNRNKVNEPGSLSRADIVEQLAKDVSVYYGYSVPLAEYFIQLFNPIEAVAFFEATEHPRPITLRTNMLNTRRRDLARILIAKGCNVDPVGDWTKVGLKVIESTVPVGATPEYCAGQYMIQSASSFVPVMALAPQPGELILDMASAPGGKSTYIGQLMKNSGVLFCNEINKERTTSLVANIHRMGLTNTIVMNMDGSDLVGKLPPVDRVLLDAPCTGLGVISRDPSVKIKRTVKDFQDQAAIQKRLLAAAVDLVNSHSATGGYVVYSTCSLSIEENEEVIDYILKARSVKVVPIDVDLGVPGFTNYREKRLHPSIKESRRIYPHIHNMDGFFVCKLKKISDVVPQRNKKDRRRHNEHVMTWGPEKWKPEFMNKALEFPEKIEAEEKEKSVLSDDDSE